MYRNTDLEVHERDTLLIEVILGLVPCPVVYVVTYGQQTVTALSLGEASLSSETTATTWETVEHITIV
jgi:hypothetical protein